MEIDNQFEEEEDLSNYFSTVPEAISLFTNLDSSQNNASDALNLNNQDSQSMQTKSYLIFPHSVDNCCEQQDESSGGSKAVVLKEKKIKKNKLKKKRKIKVVGIEYKLSNDDSVSLFNGLSITSDGVVRFQYSLGFNTHNVHQISYLKNHQMVQIIKSFPQEVKKVNLEDALHFLAHTPCRMYFEASAALIKFTQLRESIYEHICSVPNNDQLFIQKDEEMTLFIEKCLEYIQEYSSQHASEIFSYGIGRLNYAQQDIEVRNVGVSKSFLDLIGIDVDNFSACLLRQQRIDLVQDKEEILKHSIYGLSQGLLSCKEIKMIYNITTFDGFPLKITIKKRLHMIPDFEYVQLTDVPCEYIFQMSIIDIDLEELQKLIQYRERLLSGSNYLSFDDFMKKELSYLFENVEYSVHSEAFIEKYYSENLVNLHELEQKKYQFQHQLQTRSQQKIKGKQCGFSYINNPEKIQLENINQ